MLVFTILILYVFWEIYRAFFSPMKKFKHFRRRASMYESFKRHQKALAIRKQGLRLANLSNLERGDLLLSIGGTYLALGHEIEATQYFDEAFKAAEHEKFPYDRQYEKIIRAYIKAGRPSDAESVLDALIARQSYDKQFRRLENLKTELFST